MAFVRILSTLLRDKSLGRYIVPIVPDESRTFGMEGLFRQLGIFSQVGQLYSPEDAEQLMFYREDKHGQILQEGINEPGAMSSWIAAATSYANHGHGDGPVLRLLLDVRLPARRRPRVGGGRQPRARLPRRRHRRAHDAQRRGPPARGRPQPHPGVADPELRRLRPGLRLRARGDRPGRPAADGRRAGGRLLLPDDHERELRAAGDARRAREEGILRGMHLVRRPPRAKARCSCSARARSCARCSPAPTCCAEDYGVAGRRLERDLVHRAAPRRAWPPSATTGCTPAASARSLVRRAVARRARAGRRGDRLHPRAAGRHPAVDRRAVHRARHGRLRPQRLPQARCAASSRSTATTSRSPRCTRSASDDDARKAIKRYGIDADAEAPWRR